jgi:hypothetical protein
MPEERGISYANQAAEVASTFIFLGCYEYERATVTTPRMYLTHVQENGGIHGPMLRYEDVFVAEGGDFEFVAFNTSTLARPPQDDANRDPLYYWDQSWSGVGGTLGSRKGPSTPL